MARGVPVACSNRAVAAEVAGDAALLFDPTSPRAIAGAIAALLGDDAVRARLRTAGPEHARAVHLGGDRAGDAAQLPARERTTGSSLSLPHHVRQRKT